MPATILDQLPDFATAGDYCRKYAEGLARDSELAARRAEITSEMVEIRARNPKGFGIAAEIVTPKVSAETQDNPVARLLGAFAPAKGGPVINVRDADLQRARELSAEADQIDEARRVLGDQLLALHRKASKEYCTVILGAYRPLAANVAQAMIELGKLIEEQDAFVAEVQRRGAQASYLFVVQRPEWWKLRAWLKSAAEGGHIEASVIPKQWENRE